MAAEILKDFSWERMIAAVEDVRERACRAVGRFDRREFRVSSLVATRWPHGSRAWIRKPCGTPRTSTCSCGGPISPGRSSSCSRPVSSTRTSRAWTCSWTDRKDRCEARFTSYLRAKRCAPDHLLPAPEISESEAGPEFPVPTLEALVRMKLTSFRLKDQVHLLDVLEVGLIDETWCSRFPPELSARLKQLIETRDREA